MRYNSDSIRSSVVRRSLPGGLRVHDSVTLSILFLSTNVPKQSNFHIPYIICRSRDVGGVKGRTHGCRTHYQQVTQTFRENYVTVQSASSRQRSASRRDINCSDVPSRASWRRTIRYAPPNQSTDHRVRSARTHTRLLSDRPLPSTSSVDSTSVKRTDLLVLARRSCSSFTDDRSVFADPAKEASLRHFIDRLPVI